MAQFHIGWNGWELHWLFAKHGEPMPTIRPEGWINFPRREKEIQMSETIIGLVEEIKTFAGGINQKNDAKRTALTELEMLFDKIGNPGFDYYDAEPFHKVPIQEELPEATNRDEFVAFYLFFKKGKITIGRIFIKNNSKGQITKDHIASERLSYLKLDLINSLLQRLPIFLEGYLNALKAKKEQDEASLALENLNAVVLAVSNVIKK